MFIVCLDDNLKKMLFKNGFKLLKEDNSQATFLFDKKIKFDFNLINKNHFLITDRLTF